MGGDGSTGDTGMEIATWGCGGGKVAGAATNSPIGGSAARPALLITGTGRLGGGAAGPGGTPAGAADGATGGAPDIATGSALPGGTGTAGRGFGTAGAGAGAGSGFSTL